MALLSRLLWQNGILLSSLNPYSRLQLPRFITHSTLTIPGILSKMSQPNFLKQAALSLMSGSVPAILLCVHQMYGTGKVQARLDTMDARLDTMGARLNTMDARLGTMDTRLCRLDQNVKNLSAQTTNCTADCADAKKALLGYELLRIP